MRCSRWIFAAILVVGFAAIQQSSAAPPADALALQEAFEEAIKKAEPSIACILVSRSDLYQKWFGETIDHETTGKLGTFNPETVRFHGDPRDPQYEQYKKSVEKRVNSRVPEQAAREVRRLFDLSDPSNVPESYGSGVVIQENGLVLTNYHVVRNATKVYVRLPGEKGSYADIHAADPRSDLAVLRLLDAKILPVPSLKRGNGDQLRKGQLILSLANPFASGFRDGSPSASWGIISNIRRRAPGPSWWEQDKSKLTLHHYGTLLQIDARLNLGCSGGALLDLKGELVGLTTALAALMGSETAGGYAVPVDSAMGRIINVLERGEEVEYGFLGVGFDPAYDRVQEVPPIRRIPGSPAAREGLQDGDVILAVNGMPIRDKEDLFLSLGTQLAGSIVRVEYRSRGAPRVAQITLDKFYMPGKFIASKPPKTFRGMRVEYTSFLYQRDNLPSIPRGVFVREVLPGSPADTAHLQDAIIARVRDREVATPADFYRAVESLSGPIELFIVDRNDYTGFRKIVLN